MKNTAPSLAPTPRPRGRPRAFDREAVLTRAAETFHRLGYEGASIGDLTAAMGITAQSLYGAFGSKAELYRQAIAHYRATEGDVVRRALEEEPTALGAFERVLAESARQFSQAGRPRGCMISTGILTCAEENASVAEHVAAMRRGARAAFQARLERAVAEGELAAESDTEALAGFLAAVVQGMSVQAQDGADGAALSAIAGLALDELRRHRRKARRNQPSPGSSSPAIRA